jgi:hypothetical protein
VGCSECTWSKGKCKEGISKERQETPCNHQAKDRRTDANSTKGVKEVTIQDHERERVVVEVELLERDFVARWKKNIRNKRELVV